MLTILSLELTTSPQNLEYAKTLLMKLEQDAQFIKVQTRKQQTQLDLVKKRDQITELIQKLDEYNEVSALHPS